MCASLSVYSPESGKTTANGIDQEKYATSHSHSEPGWCKPALEQRGMAL
jgi:hypothetical protein